MPRPNANAQPNTVIPIALPEMWPWQQRVRQAMKTHRFTVVSSARQIGKSFFATLTAIDVAMQGGNVWWVAPNFKLTKPGYDTLVKIKRQPPFNKIMTLEKQRLLFTFTNGNKVGTIEIISADDPETVVGATLDLVVVDEAARMHPDAWYEGAFSTLTVRKGRALLISNPRGRNWFWELWKMGDPTSPTYDPQYTSFELSQYENPLVTEAEIENQRRMLPKLKFEREVLGKFTDDGGEVFVNVRKQATVQAGLPPLGVPNPDHAYYFGMDISAGRQDYTVIKVFDKTAMSFTAMYRFSEPDLQRQADLLETAYKHWNPKSILVEENNAGLFAPGFFKARGLPIEVFNTNWQTKRQLIEDYSAAIELSQISLLHDSDVITEHEAMESDVTEHGQVRYNAPRGGHDDIVIASALAYRAATYQEVKPGASMLRLPHTGLYQRGATWQFSNRVPIRPRR